MPASPNYRAGGTIETCRLVKIDTTVGNVFTVIQAAADTDKLVGVSQEGPHDPPGVTGSVDDAARVGHEIRVYGPGEECLLQLGATVVQGDLLKFATGGKGTPVLFSESTNIWAIGWALESGVLDEKIRILVEPQTLRPA